MSPKLPVISGRECMQVLSRLGYEIIRQKGSHVRMIDKQGNRSPVTVPDHKELRPGLLRKIIRDVNISVDEFEKLRNKK